MLVSFVRCMRLCHVRSYSSYSALLVCHSTSIASPHNTQPTSPLTAEPRQHRNTTFYYRAAIIDTVPVNFEGGLMSPLDLVVAPSIY